MSDHLDIAAQARPLTLQAAVFRALRARGLEPELSDTSGRPVPPAETFEEQSRRIMLSVGIAAALQATIGLGRLERRWLERVVDATCRRHEQRQRRSRSVALVSTSTATTTAVVFRRSVATEVPVRPQSADKPLVIRRHRPGGPHHAN
jgi:hypothetical protein